jgi:twitching motility two-component system response regulator PilG
VPGNNKLVLVVDDSPTIRKIVEITLKREGYRVNTCDNAMKALASVADDPPDLVLLDVMLPVMDGYKVCSIIKKRHRDMPVVMLSSKDGFFDKVRGKMVGSTHYITKPFEPRDLLAVVAKYTNAGHYDED